VLTGGGSVVEVGTVATVVEFEMLVGIFVSKTHITGLVNALFTIVVELGWLQESANAYLPPM